MGAPDIQAMSPYGRYLAHCARGQLVFQRNVAGQAVFFPRISPLDGSDELLWHVSTGLGTVYSVTIVRHRDEEPFALVLVDVDDGFRIMSRVDAPNPETVRIDDRVRVTFRPLADGQPPLPVFVPAGEGE